MVHRYSSHNEGGRNRTILLGGSRLSLIPHRFKVRQSNIGTLSARTSNGKDVGAGPVRIRRASSPARLPNASILPTDPPTAPVPRARSVMTYTGTLAHSAIDWPACVAPSRNILDNRIAVRGGSALTA